MPHHIDILDLYVLQTIIWLDPRAASLEKETISLLIPWNEYGMEELILKCRWRSLCEDAEFEETDRKPLDGYGIGIRRH